VYLFGPFRFESEHGLLTRDGQRVALTPKAAHLLSVLLDRRSNLVSKDDLMRAVWSEAHVQENTLTFHIRLVRRALGDDGEGQRYVRNMPKRGYQFVAPVTLVTDLLAPDDGGPPPADGAVRWVNTASEPADVILPGARAQLGQRGPGVAARPVELVEGRTGATRSPAMWNRVWLLLASLPVAAIGFVVVSRDSLPGPPLVTAITRLTHDTHYKGDRLLTDGSRLFHRLAATNVQVQIQIAVDGRSVHSSRTVSDFLLLDISSDGRDAVALNPQDRGAEYGLWTVPLRGGEPHRVGMVRANDAAWSSDGSRIAYTYEHSLFITDRAAHGVTTLTTMSGKPTEPRWSPDDRFIRFTVTTRSDRSASSSLFEVPVQGGEARQVIDDSPSACCGRWMPARIGFLFGTRRDGGLKISLLREEAATTFRKGRRDVIPLDSGQLEVTSAVPSPDARRIFVIGRSPPQLVRYDAQRRDFTPFLDGQAAFGLEFSRDGHWVTYIRWSDSTLWRARTNGSDARQLTFPPLAISGASTSPDGKWIALRGEMPVRRAKVYLMPSQGGEPRPLVERDVAQGIPTWSPDAMRLTFGDVPEEFGEPTGTERISLYDLRTGEFSMVPGSAGLWSSRWSPDGHSLVALTTDHQTLKVFSFASREWRTIQVGHLSHPAWSADSKWIYCDPEGPEHRFRRVRVADGFVETIVDLSDYEVPWGGVAPDGAPLILRIPSDIYALELDRR
jgi:DNA-binding winged helix-turn-helix (wHTH) protein/Tol biopolymer transport system component